MILNGKVVTLIIHLTGLSSLGTKTECNCETLVAKLAFQQEQRGFKRTITGK